jgi:hypothetical protein
MAVAMAVAVDMTAAVTVHQAAMAMAAPIAVRMDHAETAAAGMAEAVGIELVKLIYAQHL